MLSAQALKSFTDRLLEVNSGLQQFKELYSGILKEEAQSFFESLNMPKRKNIRVSERGVDYTG